MLLVKISTLLLVGLLGFVDKSDGHCVPCGREQINLDSFINCDCYLPKIFHHAGKDKCVEFSECPIEKFTGNNFFPEIKEAAPKFHEFLLHMISLLRKDSFVHSKDFRLIIEVIIKKATIVKLQVPELFSDIIGPIMSKNGDVISHCKFEPICMIHTILSRPDNMEIIMPKIPEILSKIRSIMLQGYDDLENTTNECGEKHENCPWIKSFLGLKKLLDQLPGHLHPLQRVIRDTSSDANDTGAEDKAKRSSLMSMIEANVEYSQAQAEAFFADIGHYLQHLMNGSLMKPKSP